LRWWGWGEDERAPAPPSEALELLRKELGAEGGSRPVGLDQVRLPESALGDRANERLETAVGRDHVRDDRETRVGHAAGRSYTDLVRLRSGDASSAPDAVVYPGSADEVARLLAACSEGRIAVVPFGGGTSVVGGVEPLRDGFEAAISLDLRRLDQVLEVDRVSLTARLAAGIRGPALEQALAREGLTLGHFPQSFEYSSVGGWVATRSAGQASSGYGKIEELVEGVGCLAPAGELAELAFPASAAGPPLRELIVGSEGVLGVITEATLRVRPRPEEHHYEGWWFASFEEGMEALRAVAQADACPDVARLSDREETRLTLGLAGGGGVARKLGEAYLRLRGRAEGCLAVTGFEGSAEEVARRRLRTAALLRAGGGLSLGRRPGQAWMRGRYAGPYLRDELLDRGVLAETLETACHWSALHALYERVASALRGALDARGTPPRVLCHVSHLYRSGASLYFTVLARQEAGAELEQWRVAKAAACQAIVDGGGTITHHHGVGSDHRGWLRAEAGELGLEAIRSVKERLDPAGVMNPGKLLP
jgi:alkyldihydroxyacetonephosphate synthase